MSQTMIRTFVAIEVSDEIRRKAVETIRELSEAKIDVKWVVAENMHLTLQFLGDVPEKELAAVCRSVGDAAAKLDSFPLEIFGAGAFPNLNKAKTLWLGARAGSDSLEALHDQVALALSDLGYEDDQRDFNAHLTIGRVRDGRYLGDLPRLMRERSETLYGSCEIEAVTVFASRLDRSGPHYDVLSRAKLRPHS